MRTRGATATCPGKAGLSDLLARVRKEVDGFSLTVVVLTGGDISVPGDQLLSSLHQDLDRDDVVWGIGRGPRSADWPGVHQYLDLDLEDDRRVSDVLVADLLVCGAGDSPDSLAVDDWRGRTRASIWVGSRPPEAESGLGEMARWI